MKYNPKKLEKKWIPIWEKKKIYEPGLKKAERPFYNLMMFPYPSAEGLHIGGVRTFTGVDIYGRFKRMQGFNVFEPIGLDGFGIHSENYAIKIKAHPMRLAKKTEKRFYSQLAGIGNGFAWKEHLETYDPEYYKWTQWIFLQLFKKGLAYRKKALVNWCPSCKTVLADEQVIGGECERCGTVVERKDLEQWFFKITDYADRLFENIDSLHWSEKIKIAQKNWIGKSEGTEIRFYLTDIEGQEDRKHFVDVFTTRPDTLFGATFLAISPELAKQWLDVGWKTSEEIREYITKTIAARIKKKKEDSEKTGIFSGIFGINPANQEKIPVWVTDYVLAEYGTGAIMAVPAHDQRDFDFAKKFNIAIKVVIAPTDTYDETAKLKHAYEEEGYLINSGKFTGRKSSDAKKAITEFIGGKLKVGYRLRDWLISRQRYWGPPIPMIHCESCGWVPVPEKDLPVRLPFVKDFRPRGTGESPLASVEEFYRVKCPNCQKIARRETDVSDTFLDSAWYFFRYISAHDRKQAFDIELAKKWLPVHMYIGGPEHAVLHLLYTRFITMVFHDLGLISFEEPFANFRAHGLITKDGAKMSKSKGNVVSPDEYIKRYGIDAVRMYLAFLAPFTEGGDFRDSGILGITRFLQRVWDFGFTLPQKQGRGKSEILSLLHQTIQKVTEDLEALRYNTAISALMTLLNHFEKNRAGVSSEDFGIFIKLLAPLAPVISEELWARLHAGKKHTSIHEEKFPIADTSYLIKKSFILVVQINGKLRDQFEVPMGIQAAEAERLTREREKIKVWLKGKKHKKVIFVPGRLINFVI